jgi:hypothetical protein
MLKKLHVLAYFKSAGSKQNCIYPRNSLLCIMLFIIRPLGGPTLTYPIESSVMAFRISGSYVELRCFTASQIYRGTGIDDLGSSCEYLLFCKKVNRQALGCWKRKATGISLRIVVDGYHSILGRLLVRIYSRKPTIVTCFSLSPLYSYKFWYKVKVK